MSTFFRDEPLARQTCRADVGDGLRTLRIAPWGKVESKNGAFVIDDTSASAVVAAFERHGAALSIDIEHASLDASVPPANRGAIGWLERIWAEADRVLFGLVKWTERGRELIQADAFRYFSPTFLVRKDDGRVVELLNGAITNAPAIPASERIAASRNQGKESKMEKLTELRAALRNAGATLADGADETAVLTCATAWVPKPASRDAEVAAAVRSELQLPANASKDAVVLALAMSRNGTASAQEFAKVKDAERDRVAKERVDHFVKINRLNQRDAKSYSAALSLAKSDPEQFEAIMGATKPFVEPGRTTGPLSPSGETARTTVIANASRSFEENPQTAKLTSRRAFVNDALRTASLPALTVEEEKTLVA